MGPLVLACQGDGPTPPAFTSPDDLYWRLELNHRAAWMSLAPPYDTLTLVAIPLNAKGEPLEGAPSAQFVSRDQERIAVSPTGVVKVLQTATRVPVVATLEVNGATFRDSVLVTVVNNASPPRLGSLTIQSPPPDSLTFPLCCIVTPTVSALALDTAGNVIANFPVSYRSSDLTIAGIDEYTGLVFPAGGGRLGAVTFDASTTLFGVKKVAAVHYRVGYPNMAQIAVARMPNTIPGAAPRYTFNASEVHVAVGAWVGWTLEGLVDTNQAIDLTFAATDTADVAAANTVTGILTALLGVCPFLANDCDNGGNIMVGHGTPFRNAVRVFHVPGTYEYYSNALGSGGRIIVVAE